MASLIEVDGYGREICSFDDASFPFEIYCDEYDKMEEGTLPCHWHEAVEFAFVASGMVEMTVGDQSITIKSGECAFVNSNTIHGGKRIESSKKTLVYAICFSRDILTGGVMETVYKKYVSPINEKIVQGCKIDRSFRIGCDILDTLSSLCTMCNTDYGYELAVISKISSLWLNTIKYISENKERFTVKYRTSKKNEIKDMIIYIQEHYSESISIDTLSSAAHISRSECFRCFRNYTGKTPGDYINEHRLSVAAKLLRSTNTSILDICLSVGISNQSYFGKLFKRRYGISPLRYRKENKY